MKRQVIPLEDLIAVFEQELGHVFEAVNPKGPGRPPIYPATGLFLGWLFLYLGVADSQRRLVQLLTQHPEWRTRLGFGERVPDQSTFSWCTNHRACHVFPRVFEEVVRRLVAAGVIQGDHLVVDASLFHAYSNPRKRDKMGTPSDAEASWAKETSTGQWVYGYKLHLISCADAELPIALAVTTGKRGDSPFFPPLLEQAARFSIPLHVVVADGNYHAAVNHLAAHHLGAATVIPLPDRRHRAPQTLAQRLRLSPMIARGSALYRRLARKRQSVERVFARLKRHFSLDQLRVRGLAKATPHALLALTSMLVYALTAATLGLDHLVRSPTRLTV